MGAGQPDLIHWELVGGGHSGAQQPNMLGSVEKSIDLSIHPQNYTLKRKIYPALKWYLLCKPAWMQEMNRKWRLLLFSDEQEVAQKCDSFSPEHSQKKSYKAPHNL